MRVCLYKEAKASTPSWGPFPQPHQGVKHHRRGPHSLSLSLGGALPGREGAAQEPPLGFSCMVLIGGGGSWTNCLGRRPWLGPSGALFWTVLHPRLGEAPALRPRAGCSTQQAATRGRLNRSPGMRRSASLLAATVVVAEPRTIILGKQAEERDTPEGGEAPGFQAAALIATRGGRPGRVPSPGAEAARPIGGSDTPGVQRGSSGAS